VAESITRGGEIYFIGERDLIEGQKTSYVKIGLTRDDRASEERQSDHQTGNPRELFLHHAEKVVMVQTVEKALHWHYAERRVAGEWFFLEEHRLAASIEMCRILGEKLLEHVPAVTLAEQLENVLSHGEPKTPDDISLEWWRRHQIAHHVITACDDLIERYDSALDDERLKGNDISDLAQRKPRVSPHFDEKGFREKYPDIWASHLGEPVVKGRFTVTSFSDDLSSEPEIVEIQPVLDSFGRIIDEFRSGNVSPKDLKKSYLRVFSQTEYQKTRKNLARHYLMSLCGESPSIVGVCKWKRSQTDGKLDRNSLRSAEPEKMAEFTTFRESEVLVRSRRAGSAAADD
jgi:hypothetical protein